MEIKTYLAVLRHDKGTIRLEVVSLSDQRGAIEQILAVEGCPENAILEINEINTN